MSYSMIGKYKLTQLQQCSICWQQAGHVEIYVVLIGNSVKGVKNVFNKVKNNIWERWCLELSVLPLYRNPGVSKFYFGVLFFLFKFVRVKYVWVQIRARKVFQTLELLLAGLRSTPDQFKQIKYLLSKYII